MSKIAVVGSSSMVGSRFCDLTKKDLIKADFKAEVSVNITDSQSVREFFLKNDFNCLILFSAFTDVDAAELQRNNKRGSCWQINVEGAKNIVKLCAEFKRKLIFFSTDFVFDGKNGPYSEEFPKNQNLKKISWYGMTKLEAEKIIRESLEEFIILRITYPYRAKFMAKDDIAKRILRLFLEDKLYPLFADQITTPTFIDDLTPAIELLLESEANGVFHVASPEVCNQFEFGSLIIKTFGYDQKRVQKGSLEQFLKSHKATPRPQKGGLQVNKIKQLGFTPTGWDMGIKKIFEQSKGQLL